MQRFLYRVQYTHRDGSIAYEPITVRAEDDDTTSALAEVTSATARYPRVVGATRVITLVTVTADV